MRALKDDYKAPLAEAVPADDEPGQCHAEGCTVKGAIELGDGAELAYCPDHAAVLVLNLLVLPEVHEALAKRRQAVLVLNEQLGELTHLDVILDNYPPSPDPAREDFRNDLLGRLDELLTLHHGPAGPTT